MEEKEYTSLTVPSTDYLQQWYQNSHQTEGHRVLQYHNQDPYSTEAFGTEPHLTELEPALHHHDFPSHQSYTSAALHHTLDYHTYEEDQHHPHYGPTAGPQQSSYGQPPPEEPFQQASYGKPPPAEPSQAATPGKKKRGRPPKRKAGEEGEEERSAQDEEQEQAAAARKAKRTLNRFNGMSVDEVMAKTLPDIITYNLDILIIGINPGLMSAFKGRHYPNPGNHFWKCLFLAGFTDEQLNFMHDQSLPEKYGIGFTNMVERTTPGSKDLSSKEIREGGRQLLQKLQKYKPLIAAFNGKGIYEIFCKEIFGVKATNLEFGLQPYKIPETETLCYLMPSSSPRCAQFPRAQDKVHFYIKLKELRDKVKDLSPSHDVEETKYSFDLQLAKEDAKRISIKEEQVDPEFENCGGAHSDERQTTDYCSIPSTKHTGMDSKEQVAGHMTYDQWMSQIPDINCNSSNAPVLHAPLGTQSFEDTT